MEKLRDKDGFPDHKRPLSLIANWETSTKEPKTEPRVTSSQICSERPRAHRTNHRHTEIRSMYPSMKRPDGRGTSPQHKESPLTLGSHPTAPHPLPPRPSGVPERDSGSPLLKVTSLDEWKFSDEILESHPIPLNFHVPSF